MIITCPKCFTADDVRPPRRLPDGVLQYRCTNRRAHGDHEWLTTREAVQPPSEVREGVTDDLLDPLDRCVDPDDPFLEYGIVEHRLRTRFPDLFAAHVAEQGHSMFGSRAYTASSVRFGVALGRLERTGTLLSQYGPATGAWRYNGQVTYWTRAATQGVEKQPSTQRRKTWAEHCAEVGRSPDWTDDDRHGLTTPSDRSPAKAQVGVGAGRAKSRS
ncbi:hypothetical protein [Saccharothrix yanglingensis]|uniref:Uncharacterized protein n=1 Tax=Saccharothrix yanglingensis TaxID=659496 RepID=A0ABU0XBZ0_9PSEU|nr:hypothetical protein [Saccharothrix yanglingensis]MDQ2589142.1 hypothetical protein [Saccharothrix yanglingensis]